MHTYWYLLFVICTIVLYTTCYIVCISMYVQWQLHRIPVHQSGPVHRVWWTGGPGPGSKWILVCHPTCCSIYVLFNLGNIRNIINLIHLSIIVLIRSV